MTDLVFLSPNTREPFTTSAVIAEMSNERSRRIS